MCVLNKWSHIVLLDNMDENVACYTNYFASKFINVTEANIHSDTHLSGHKLFSHIGEATIPIAT